MPRAVSLLAWFERVWTNPEEKAKWMRLLWYASFLYLAFGYLMIVVILHQQGKLPLLP